MTDLPITGLPAPHLLPMRRGTIEDLRRFLLFAELAASGEATADEQHALRSGAVLCDCILGQFDEQSIHFGDRGINARTQRDAEDPRAYLRQSDLAPLEEALRVAVQAKTDPAARGELWRLAAAADVAEALHRIASKRDLFAAAEAKPADVDETAAFLGEDWDFDGASPLHADFVSLSPEGGLRRLRAFFTGKVAASHLAETNGEELLQQHIYDDLPTALAAVAAAVPGYARQYRGSKADAL